MHDDDPSTDVDRRLRAALRPPEDRVRALIAGALSAGPDSRPQRRRPRVVAVAAAAALIALAVALRWGTAPPPAPHRRRTPADLEISGTSSLIVVTRADGSRFVFGPSTGSPVRGEYVIAFPPSER